MASLKRVSSARLAMPELPSTMPMAVTASSPASCWKVSARVATPSTAETRAGAFWNSGTLPWRKSQPSPQPARAPRPPPTTTATAMRWASSPGESPWAATS